LGTLSIWKPSADVVPEHSMTKPQRQGRSEGSPHEASQQGNTPHRGLHARDDVHGDAHVRPGECELQHRSHLWAGRYTAFIQWKRLSRPGRRPSGWLLRDVSCHWQGAESRIAHWADGLQKQPGRQLLWHIRCVQGGRWTSPDPDCLQ
jgi:hypothetical protein